MSKKVLACWSLTIPVGDISPEKIKNCLQKIAKHWGFQKEKPFSETKSETFLHYQIQFSLIKKTTRSRVSKFFYDLLGIQIPPESRMLSPLHVDIDPNTRKNSFQYVSKEDSRVEGPWTSDDKETSFSDIPGQIEFMTVLYPWQQRVLDICNQQLDRNRRDNRTIHSINDLVGNSGKSAFCTWMEYHKKAVRLPFNNNSKDLLQAAMAKPSHAYLIDIPRSVDKRKLEEFFTAIEYIKDGYMYDSRYTFKERYQSSPCIFLFSNEKVGDRFLSRDRWQYWLLTHDHKMIHYTKEREEIVSLQKLALSEQDDMKKKQIYPEDDWQPELVTKNPTLIAKYNSLLHKTDKKKVKKVEQKIFSEEKK